MAKRHTKTKDFATMGRAEIKISLVLAYYILVGVMALVSFIMFDVKKRKLRLDLGEFLLCAASQDCSDSLPPLNMRTALLADLVVIMLSCFPLVTLLFSLDLTPCTRRLRTLRAAKKAVANPRNEGDRARAKQENMELAINP